MQRILSLLVLLAGSICATLASGAEHRVWKLSNGGSLAHDRKLVAFDGKHVTLEKQDDFTREQFPLDAFDAGDVRLVQLWAQPDRRAAVEWALANGFLRIEETGRIGVYFLGGPLKDATFQDLLRHFPDLGHLECNPTALSAAAWATLTEFKQLQSLSLKLEPSREQQAGKMWNPRFDVLPQLKSLTSLSLEGRDFPLTDHILSLADVPLKSFKVDYLKLSDKDLQFIASWPQLRELELRPANRQSLSLLKNLATAKNLTALLLPNTGLNAEDGRHIANFTRLTRLSFDNCVPAGFVEVAKLTELESLDIYGFGTDNQVNDVAAKHLSRLKKLKRLNLRTAKLTTAGLADVGTLPELQELVLSTLLPPEGIQKLAPLRKLKRLWFNSELDPTLRLSHVLELLVDRQGRSVQEALHVLSHLNPLTGPLESVQGAPRLDIAAAKYLVQLPELQHMIFNDGQADEWLQAFRDMRGVRVLTIMATPSYFGSKADERLKISRAGLANLDRWERLHYLFLMRCDFVEDALAHVPHPERIKAINLPDCVLPPGSLHGLRKFTNLEELLITSDARGFDMKILSELSHLKRVKITEPFSLAALRELKGLKQLQTVEVRLTQLEFADLYRLFTTEFGRTPQQAVEMICLFKRDRNGKLMELGLDPGTGLHTGFVDNTPKLTNKDLAVLANFPTLQNLTLPVDLDATGLQHLQSLPQLQQLSFRTPTLTEQGLARALTLPKLKKLIVVDSKLDAAIIDKLRKEHPTVEIELKESLY